jgi:hypothetical protein
VKSFNEQREIMYEKLITTGMKASIRLSGRGCKIYILCVRDDVINKQSKSMMK